jgi:hypothetical protein
MGPLVSARALSRVEDQLRPCGGAGRARPVWRAASARRGRRPLLRADGVGRRDAATGGRVRGSLRSDRVDSDGGERRRGDPRGGSQRVWAGSEHLHLEPDVGDADDDRDQGGHVLDQRPADRQRRGAVSAGCARAAWAASSARRGWTRSARRSTYTWTSFPRRNRIGSRIAIARAKFQADRKPRTTSRRASRVVRLKLAPEMVRVITDEIQEISPRFGNEQPSAPKGRRHARGTCRRGVAQPGRASGSGPEGRWFESSRRDINNTRSNPRGGIGVTADPRRN